MLTPEQAFNRAVGKSKNYTNDAIEGTSGPLAGKPCEVESVEEIEGGTRVTLAWYHDDESVARTESFDILNGIDGEDGAKGDTGAQGPKGDKGDMGVSVPSGGTTGQHLRKKSNTDYDFEWESIDGALSNVSTGPVQNKVIKEALDTKANASLIGEPSGIAELDENGKVPASQLPSYVDDVIEGYYKESDGKFYEEATYETEIEGEDGKIYISIDSNIQYRWTGSAFSALGGALVLGETSTTAYRGDRGKQAYDVAQTVGDVNNLQTISSQQPYLLSMNCLAR